MASTAHGRLIWVVIVSSSLVAACAASDGSGSGSGGRSGSGGATGTGTGGNTTSGSGGSNGTTGSGGEGGSGSGGMTQTGTGGTARDAGTDTRGGTGGVNGGSGGASGTGDMRCQAANLSWKTGTKTNFESYPAPGSPECIQFSGCMYEGLFAACPTMRPESWVMSHNIVAAFPLGNLSLHDLCVKAGNKTIVVTVLDTCADSDCSGCCTQNKGNASLLIDFEKYTDQRFGVADGAVQWADLGPTTGSGCN